MTDLVSFDHLVHADLHRECVLRTSRTFLVRVMSGSSIDFVCPVQFNLSAMRAFTLFMLEYIAYPKYDNTIQ